MSNASEIKVLTTAIEQLQGLPFSIDGKWVAALTRDGDLQFREPRLMADVDAIRLRDWLTANFDEVKK